MKNSMLIAIDIGNSEITLGLFEGERLVATDRVATSAVSRERLADVIMRLAGGGSVDGAVLCSVVPACTDMVTQACEDAATISPIVVSAASDTGLVIRYATPERLGIDRLINAAAAWARRQGAAIVVDFGTATTFDVVNSAGEYMGGAIFPGLKLAAASLAEKTASLPLVEPARPVRIIGQSTEECIRSALYYGYAGLVDRMVLKMKEELGEPAAVLATGGMAGLLAGECNEIDEVIPFLTLQGLKVIYKARERTKGIGSWNTAPSNEEVRK